MPGVQATIKDLIMHETDYRRDSYYILLRLLNISVCEKNSICYA